MLFRSGDDATNDDGTLRTRTLPEAFHHHSLHHLLHLRLPLTLHASALLRTALPRSVCVSPGAPRSPAHAWLRRTIIRPIRSIGFRYGSRGSRSGGSVRLQRTRLIRSPLLHQRTKRVRVSWSGSTIHSGLPRPLILAGKTCDCHSRRHHDDRQHRRCGGD